VFGVSIPEGRVCQRGKHGFGPQNPTFLCVRGLSFD